MFEAYNQARYHRQSIIREVESITGNRLIVVFANLAHPGSLFSQFDVAPFQDLLLDCVGGDRIDLLLQTPGGDIDTAEKLVYMVRQRASAFRLIVTERAKSAGTLIACASDSILMAATSELGPIDPQITLTQADGKLITRPAQSFLDGLEQIKQDVAKNNGVINPAFFPLLSQLDPALLDYCVKTIGRSQQFAEKWLSKYMLAGQPIENAKAIAKSLADVNQYRTHGMVIDMDEASQLGLKVDRQQVDSPIWQSLWKLHSAYDVFCRMNGGVSKIFESRKISLVL